MTKFKTFIAGALLGALVCTGLKSIDKELDVITPKTTKKIDVISDIVDEKYLKADEINKDQMMDGVLKGYMSGLNDPYSTYFNKKEAKAIMEQTKGSFAGIGALMAEDRDTKKVTIEEVYENTPAKKAGLKKGDVIIKVNGKDMTDKDISFLVKKVRGEAGTKVKITVLRGTKEKEFSIVRGIVNTPTVFGKMLDKGVGYLRITEFDDVTTKQFKDEKKSLEESGMKKLVIDLRGNPGGNLDTVVDMLNAILPKGKIVTIRDRNGKEEVYRSQGKTPLEIPLVVLINENSASASEIFAGAVQDYKIGTIVGKTSYGKGIVQQLYPLTDGTMLKLTVAEYLTPKGRNIHKKGVKPDVEEDFVVDIDNANKDTQLDRALQILEKD